MISEKSINKVQCGFKSSSRLRFKVSPCCF
nr:MAG TPA: hypothetical protein [Caudoviricetes sp.]